MTSQPMTGQEHIAQGHESSYLACKVCWASVVFAASPEPSQPAESAPITYAESRGMERAWGRIAKPATSGRCRRCGTYCDGDCTAR